jgi:hypothetical protein
LTRWRKYVKARHLILLSDIFESLEGYFLKEKLSGKEVAQRKRRARIASVPEIIVVAAIQAMAPKLPKNETK